jgi:carboxymethylenebutenolidase
MTEFQKYLVEEYLDDYQKGYMSRRQALKLIAGVTGSLAVANGLLAACAAPASVPAATDAATAAATVGGTAAATTAAPAAETAAPTPDVPEGVRVAPDDPDIIASPVEFPSDGATVMGYLARPTGDGPFPAVLVSHENRGLQPHIEDVARRLAKAGYVALAVDLLSREGGTAAMAEDDVPGVLGNTPPEQFVADFTSGWEYLKTQDFVRPDAVGMVGFCFGGGVTWRVATALPDLVAAVPFYGPPPPLEEVPDINAAVLAVYAGDDTRINESIPGIEEAMAAAGKTYEKAVFPGVDHAFHNDTRERYNAEAAVEAWARTLAWFEEHLNTSG